MAVKFTKGDSVKTTVTTAQKGKVREPPTKSVGGQGRPVARNTMNGMPGFVRTGMGADSDNLRGGKQIRPKGPPGEMGQGREIGRRGKGSTAKRLQSGNATGTMGDRAAWMGGGHRGRMERLQGTTKSFTERKRSNMY